MRNRLIMISGLVTAISFGHYFFENSDMNYFQQSRDILYSRMSSEYLPAMLPENLSENNLEKKSNDSISLGFGLLGLGAFSGLVLGKREN